MRFIKIKITERKKNVLDELQAHARFGHFSAALVDEQSDRRFVQEL